MSSQNPRIVRARSITIKTGTGDKAKFVDVMAGDELPSGVSREQIADLDAQHALLRDGEALPAFQTGDAPALDAVSGAPASADAGPDPEPFIVSGASDDDLAAWVAKSSIDEIVSVLGEDADAKARVLAAEKARGKDARLTLTERLAT